MGTLLGSLHGLNTAGFENHTCSFGAVGKERVRREFPTARCHTPGRGGTPVASVRGNVRQGCYFVDQEYPPVEHEGKGTTGRSEARQPGLCDVAHAGGLMRRRDPFLSLPRSASLDVATRCLRLSEGLDPRIGAEGSHASGGGAAGRHDSGGASACRPRGGWDGDFRNDASPWDTSEPNRRRGMLKGGGDKGGDDKRTGGRGAGIKGGGGDEGDGGSGGDGSGGGRVGPAAERGGAAPAPPTFKRCCVPLPRSPNGSLPAPSPSPLRVGEKVVLPDCQVGPPLMKPTATCNVTPTLSHLPLYPPFHAPLQPPLHSPFHRAARSPG